MNNKNKTKEYMTDKEVISHLQNGGGVRPPESLLRSTLGKLPDVSASKSVSSPYFSFFALSSNFRKSAFASVIVLMLLVVGGVAYKVTTKNNLTVNQTQQITTSNNTSDTALAQDLNNIDAQLNALNMDNASADQALSM